MDVAIECDEWHLDLIMKFSTLDIIEQSYHLHTVHRILRFKQYIHIFCILYYTRIPYIFTKTFVVLYSE